MIALVIDDEKDQRDLICSLLEAAGWRVELAEDGTQGGRSTRGIVATGADVSPYVRDLADAVLTKPFSESDLLSALRVVLAT